MRLSELQPRWLAEPGRTGQGVVFDCPCCVGKPNAVRLVVAFRNPLDSGAPFPIRKMAILWEALKEGDDPRQVTKVPPGTHWERTGEIFEDMTFAPSVDASPAGHWHGFVRNGAIT